MKLRSGRIILSVFNTKNNICELYGSYKTPKSNILSTDMLSYKSIIAKSNNCVKCELISYYDYHVKECGHACCINSINKCCKCTDKRSICAKV